MYEILFVIGIVTAVLAGAFLISTVSMFFGFNIPELRKETSGALEQKQIEEIRKNNSAAASKRGKVNVFEDLEKKAKVKKTNTHSLNAEVSIQKNIDVGTSVLSDTSASVNPNFIIEKNIMFVSTNEVI